MTLVLREQEEQARQVGAVAFRGYIDLGTFFMSVVREVAEEVERHLGVRPEVQRVMCHLQGVVKGRCETEFGLTEETDVDRGLGQGDINAPNRSKNLMKLKQRAISGLVEGYQFWGREEGTAQVWFADDGALMTDDWDMLQLGFDVAWHVARMCGNVIGIKEDGSKTAWQVVNGAE